MYLTAHRVVSLTTGMDGINAFYRLHRDGWVGINADPETTPSELVRSQRTVPVGGNRVRSYLDIVAPDSASPGALIAEFQNFVLGPPPERFPCETASAEIRLRFGIERSLAASWRAEAQRLFYECLHVWIGDATGSSSAGARTA